FFAIPAKHEDAAVRFVLRHALLEARRWVFGCRVRRLLVSQTKNYEQLRNDFGPRTDSAIQWLLDGDPAIRWQALRDLVGAAERTVERERRKVARDGWGARLLARILRARGPAGWRRTAGCTRQSGSRPPIPCCCSVT